MTNTNPISEYLLDPKAGRLQSQDRGNRDLVSE
jgi:hypothetical protein